MSSPNSVASDKNRRSLAIVSGKGGTGKTMIATAMAEVFASSGKSVVLIDADTGTGGMTYYLGLKQVRNIRGGLYAMMKNPVMNVQSDNGSPEEVENFSPDNIRQYLQDIADLSARGGACKFLPIGDHRRLSRDERTNPDETARQYANIIHGIIPALSKLFDYVIVDCRGGVDHESLEVCEAVDDIFLIAESDTTSFQASRHLVEVLSDARLDHKLRGFIVNKAFEDPTSIARNGTSMFGAQYLGSVPFDFEATRAFLVGNLPNYSSIFITHVQDALDKAYPGKIRSPYGKIWTADDYNTLGLPANQYSAIGGYVATLLLVSAGVVFLIKDLFLRPTVIANSQFNAIAIAVLTLLGLFAGIEPLRRIVGRLVQSTFFATMRWRYK